MEAIIDIEARESSCDTIEEEYSEDVKERKAPRSIKVGPLDFTQFLQWLKEEGVPTHDLEINVVEGATDDD